MKVERFAAVSAQPVFVPSSPNGLRLRERGCVPRSSNRSLKFEADMPAVLIAIVVFVVVALGTFAVVSLFDQRSAQARLIKERLANERKAPERAPEEEL